MDLRPVFNFFHHSKGMFVLVSRSKKLVVQFLDHPGWTLLLVQD